MVSASNSDRLISRRAWLVGLLTFCISSSLLAVNLTAKVAWENVSGSEASRKNKDVVVWLAPISPVSSTSPLLSAAPVTLIQRNKSFEPHVVVVPVGSVIQFPNRDPFFHNVFSLFEGKRFDLGLYEAGTSRNVHFDKPGVSYIFCNIHPEMSAVVIASPTPFHAISDAHGNINIPDVPPGRYRLHLWYESALPEELNAMTREITVSENASNLGVLSLKFSGLAKPHKNKYGQDYEPPNPGNPAYIRP
jgi:plastocyanin